MATAAAAIRRRGMKSRTCARSAACGRSSSQARACHLQAWTRKNVRPGTRPGAIPAQPAPTLKGHRSGHGALRPGHASRRSTSVKRSRQHFRRSSSATSQRRFQSSTTVIRSWSAVHAAARSLSTNSRTTSSGSTFTGRARNVCTLASPLVVHVVHGNGHGELAVVAARLTQGAECVCRDHLESPAGGIRMSRTPRRSIGRRSRAAAGAASTVPQVH